MKIAQVCPYDFSRPGGVKSHIESLSLQLRKKGHEVTIIAPLSGPRENDEYGLSFFGRTRGVNFGGTRIDVNLATGEDYKRLKHFLTTGNFDLIHYHTIWNPLLPIQIRLLSKAKNIATFHDTPGAGWFGKFAGKVLMPAASSVLFRFLDEVISVSPSQARFITSFSGKPVHIIPNGIDLDKFHPGVKPYDAFADGMTNLLFLGRLEPRKGIFFALQAFELLKKEHAALRLIVAGDGQQRREAEEFCRQRGLSDVVFLGFVKEEDKAALIKRADVLLAPALYGESFGIVLLEAFACGTPVAGFGNMGYLNVVGTGPYRLFFPPPGDLKTFAAGVSTIIGSPQTRQQLVAWGASEVRKYDWDQVSDEVLSIYSGTLR